MLTRKQLDLLKFIYDRVSADGVSPSFDEMKAALNLKSKSGIHRLITALEERGFIRRLAHRARAIEIIRLPEGVEDASGGTASGDRTVIEHDFRPKPAGNPRGAKPVEALQAEAGSIPLLGRIAAGTPIEAIQHTVDHVAAPMSMLGVQGGHRGDHYALEVKGDSMIDAGIREGDIVVVRRQDSADDGDIVVALIEDQEATLKTLRRTKGAVELHAANPVFETQRYTAGEVKIQGRMVGLIRTY